MDLSTDYQLRYHRQTLLPWIGPEGQARLANSRILLIGCGALGATIADQLVRAGVGHLRIIDRDIVELTNLQRQTLFDENDVAQSLPKSIAAANRLRKINSTITIDPHVADVHSGNIEDLVFNYQLPTTNYQLILDGTDNVETRYLINDLAIKHSIPWIYGAAVGTEGRVMPILPTQTPCLRCIFPDPPPPGQLATCDTAGVLGPLTSIVGSLQAAIALKLLTGHAITPELLTLDLASNRFWSINLKDARRTDCPACSTRRFEFLDSRTGPGTTTLCGRNAVQIRPQVSRPTDLDQLAARLSPAGSVQKTPYFIRCAIHDPAGISLSVFSDGRVIVHGTSDPGRARSLAARFVGA